ncbi:uncharacterized protein [Physcomitrium patens]|uniref:RING-type E3 ubiquitin transferase n=1 Tax=Physcomitrium patens TaxID=3218 RepID=A9SDU8_PHYPA|nr:uncharacterized protein LOC112294905 [Physcomitrium patens]PNR36712.1 hypothetical protein PHYPA_022563 [Physcomitrium patens]|eukprot:XP_024401664.1 uncharacterized protein LOC112294905 [Physcomitrella patens]
MAVWEWLTDAMLWKPYNSVLSDSIEASFQVQQPSLDVCITSPSAPTHSITFQSIPPCQINRNTQQSRPVRRNVDAQSGIAEWQWWEDESQRWHAYDVLISSQIEIAWGQGHNSTNAYFQASTPGGVSLRIHHRKYTILFEADGLQTNLSTGFSRKIRRRVVSPGTAAAGATPVVPAASPSAPHVSSLLQAHSVPAPSVAAGAVSEAYDPADLHPYVENSDCNECPICVMDLRGRNAAMLAKCRHLFCKDCIIRWFETRPTCPICNMAYGVITGTQPDGTMSVRIIRAGSPEFASGLEGFPGVDVIVIQYNFPSGIQGPEHPSPGCPYTGTRRVAYLPYTKEGEDVLNLLKIAWDRRLLFSVGTSITTGRRDVVTWSGVHHKTSTWGGPTNFGYPDSTYFARVKAELSEKGVR